VSDAIIVVADNGRGLTVEQQQWVALASAIDGWKSSG